MPWNSRSDRRPDGADQFANRGGNALLDVEGKPSSGSPRSVPSMKAGTTGGYTSRSKFAGSSTNPAGVGFGTGKGGRGAANGA